MNLPMNFEDGLYVPLAAGDIGLEPIAERHREGLRAATSADSEIWKIYPSNYAGEAFDAQFDSLLSMTPIRRVYAIFEGDRLVGMTAWIMRGDPGWAIEIGNSYIMPELRGSGFNTRLKQLMLDHAFACGLERVEFRVDQRNRRSQAAVLKLGATREGLLRAERKTWTGHVRDTVVFAILRGEWAARG
jgi:RimJ/RimL family protein N-acetyltransferase